MSAFVFSGRATDVVLAVLLIEFFWLIWRGRQPASVAFALIPAALMLLAIKAALGGWDWVWIAGPLAASLPVHLADLRRRGWI